MNALVAQTDAPRPNLVAGGRPMAIVPQTMDEAYRLGKAISISGMAPRGMDTPEKCMIAIMRGMEVGLSPMQAVDKIAIVNGRPTIWGDGAIGLVRGSGLCEFIQERLEGDGDKRIATCSAKRKGEPEPTVRTFSVEQAKKAGLWGKSGPWQQFPDRMLQMRARAFALRDLFADVLGGLYLREEIEDDRPARNDTPPPATRRAEPAVAQVIEHKVATPAEAAGAPDHIVGAERAAADASGEDGVVTADELLTDLDDRLGHASTADEVEEGYTDFDAEALLSDYPDGVQRARKLKADHFERVGSAAAPVRQVAEPAAEDAFPGDEALERVQAQAYPPDPWVIPEFKGGGHYEIWIRTACDAATTSEHEDRLRLLWSQTKPQRDDLAAQGQIDNVVVKLLLDDLKKAFERIQADNQPNDDLPPPAPRRAAPEPQKAEAPPPAEKPASADPVAAYTARMEAEFATVATKEQVDQFWFATSDERDDSGASEEQRSKWKIARNARKNALPSAEG